MKFNQAVRNLYKKYEENAKLQKSYYDSIFEKLCEKKDFFYESRIKKIESFALKIETGRNSYEDFFGCRFVVIRKKDIFELKDILLNDYDLRVLYSRPKNLDEVGQLPENFAFNDLRMYVDCRQKKNVKEKEFLKIPFEIQIMTLYSYVWAKTTHDLIYKGKNISWGKSRIAYQIKALLEQAQYAIDTIEKTDEDYFPKHNHFEQQKEVLEYIITTWDKNLLPDDLNRLSNNVLNLIKNLKSSIQEMKEIINTQKFSEKNYLPINITPYQYILKSYLNQRPDRKSVV